MPDININLKLDVFGQGNDSRVIAPGNEPPSDATSRTLLAQWGKRYVYAAVRDVLCAIPGSYILFGDNFAGANFGVVKRWLVLPPHRLDCSCAPQPDYYAIIRALAVAHDLVEEKFDYCDVIGMNFQPSPDWDETPPPPPDPFHPEGQSPYGGAGILPLVPPWAYKTQRDARVNDPTADQFEPPAEYELRKSFENNDKACFDDRVDWPWDDLNDL